MASGLVPKTTATRLEPALNPVVSLVIVASLVYVLGLFALSRRRPAPVGRAPDSLFFVAMVPCLNEELVIGSSLQRLEGFDPGQLAVLVIDDGSDDRTADIVRAWAVDHPGVHLFSRTAPHAREGKGEALNAAFRYLRDDSGGVLAGRDRDDVVLLVLDADGRIEANALDEVGPMFADPQVGAVQIGVRMYNAHQSVLAALQDFEFVTYTEIFQRARELVGSVGLGGNGQFARLSALESLGDAPWTDCLTEDLDLGIRLLASGHTNRFCSTTFVAQQALLSPRRLLRQRARWFQGHLQCLGRIPLILRSPLSQRTTMDLLQHLLSPILVLMISLLPPLLLVGVVSAVAADPGGVWSDVTGLGPEPLFVAYALAFGLTPFYAFAYWLRDGRIPFLAAFGLAHLFSVYSFLWFPAGWRALWAVVRRRRGWAKTARNEPSPLEAAQPG